MRKVNIQYLWIDKWRNYEDAGFNFSSKYNFEYKKSTNELIVTNNSQNYCNNFFGDNIDITAVNGQNGIGKTSLLDFIVKIITDTDLKYKFIVVFEVNTENKYETKIYSNDIEYVKYNNGSVEQYSREVINEFEFVTVLYNYALTNSYYLNSNEMFFDLTTSYLINQSEKIQGACIKSYHDDERMMQLRFLSSYGKYIEDFGINYPEEITLSFKNIDFYINKFSNEYKQSILDAEKLMEKMLQNNGKEYSSKFVNEQGAYIQKCKSYEFSDNLKEFLHDLFYSSNANNKEIFSERIVSALFNEILAMLYYYNADLDNHKYYDVMLDFINKISKETKNKNSISKLRFIISKMNELLGALDLSTPLRDSVLEPWFILSNIEKEFEDFLCYFENEVLNNDWIISSFDKTSFKLKLSCSVEGDVNALGFYNEYRKVSKYFDFLSYDFSMSSGEIALLSLYSRFHSILHVNRTGSYKHMKSDMKNRNVIVLLDEAEVLFHPEWQRKYLNKLMAFLEDAFAEAHLQLIVATHSPILLSDVPKQNTILLKKVDDKIVCDKGEETFGANIYSLYNNAFFMEKGAIGEFATQYIRNIIDEIKKLDDKALIPIIERKISMIGDNFIKKQLVTMLKQSKVTDHEYYNELVDKMSLKDKRMMMEILKESIEKNKETIDA